METEADGSDDVSSPESFLRSAVIKEDAGVTSPPPQQAAPSQPTDSSDLTDTSPVDAPPTEPHRRPAVLSWADGRSTVWEDPKAATIGKGATGTVLRGFIEPAPEGHGQGEEAAIKIVVLGSLTDKEDREDTIKELQVEVDRLQRLGGAPPFLPLLAAHTNEDQPLTYTNTKGLPKEALCIATPLLHANEWVEMSRLFGWAQPHEGDRIHNLYQAIVRLEDEGFTEEAKAAFTDTVEVITRALILACEAHIAAVGQGVLHLDGAMGNVMLRRSALRPGAALSVNDVHFIDLANSLATNPPRPPSTPSNGPSPAPPTFLGDKAVLVPTERAERMARGQMPNGGRWNRAPELVAALGPPAGASAIQERTATGLGRTRRQLRAEGVLVGDGNCEAVWMGPPAPVFAFGMTLHQVLRASPITGVVMREETDTARKDEELLRKYAALMALEWEAHYDALMDAEGQPTESPVFLRIVQLRDNFKGLTRSAGLRGGL
ncbi:unnamed protein product [Vitrella brassicaformis CCMP3155]|uniref:Protein kinase domain-containing protein n=1 Tax=Vitrella brassicaformis (strain CCMP3155) TaxID=1169540 RepID=A0A0G4GHY8_VITBC|nr:unnamed protein product [Vitrella brassicaformis CCMP3155]|eukprot:CEM29223.1 unnamed protein product [Vitrella brassicaformis CCMP3155]